MFQTIERGLSNGQLEMLHMNLAKQVTVMLLGGRAAKLYIHGAQNYSGEFRYVMHPAKKPKYAFIQSEDTNMILHENIANGYYLVNPMRIIL